MSKNLLSEGMVDKIILWFMSGKINKATEEFKKDPEVKKAVDNINKAKAELKASIERVNNL